MENISQSIENNLHDGNEGLSSILEKDVEDSNEEEQTESESKETEKSGKGAELVHPCTLFQDQPDPKTMDGEDFSRKMLNQQENSPRANGNPHVIHPETLQTANSLRIPLHNTRSEPLSQSQQMPMSGMGNYMNQWTTPQGERRRRPNFHTAAYDRTHQRNDHFVNQPRGPVPSSQMLLDQDEFLDQMQESRPFFANDQPKPFFAMGMPPNPAGFAMGLPGEEPFIPMEDPFMQPNGFGMNVPFVAPNHFPYRQASSGMKPLLPTNGFIPPGPLQNGGMMNANGVRMENGGILAQSPNYFPYKSYSSTLGTTETKTKPRTVSAATQTSPHKNNHAITMTTATTSGGETRPRLSDSPLIEAFKDSLSIENVGEYVDTIFIKCTMRDPPKPVAQPAIKPQRMNPIQEKLNNPMSSAMPNDNLIRMAPPKQIHPSLVGSLNGQVQSQIQAQLQKQMHQQMRKQAQQQLQELQVTNQKNFLSLKRELPNAMENPVTMPLPSQTRANVTGHNGSQSQRNPKAQNFGLNEPLAELFTPNTKRVKPLPDMQQFMLTASTNDSMRTTPALPDDISDKQNGLAGALGVPDGLNGSMNSGRRGRRRRRNNSNGSSESNPIGEDKSLGFSRQFQALSQVLEPIGPAMPPKQTYNYGPFAGHTVVPQTVRKDRRRPQMRPESVSDEERPKPREIDEDDLLIPEGKEILPAWEDGESNPFVNFAKKMKKYNEENGMKQSKESKGFLGEKKGEQNNRIHLTNGAMKGKASKGDEMRRRSDKTGGNARGGARRDSSNEDNDEQYSHGENWNGVTDARMRSRRMHENPSGMKRFKGNDEEDNGSPKAPLIINNKVFL